jgi:hypothetical protein
MEDKLNELYDENTELQSKYEQLKSKLSVFKDIDKTLYEDSHSHREEEVEFRYPFRQNYKATYLYHTF